MLSRRVRLEKLEATVDAVFLAEHLNDWEMTRYMLFLPYPYTIDDGERFLIEITSSDSCMENAIVERETNRVIGIMSFAHIDLEHRHAEIGYWLTKEAWGRGYASEAANLLIRYGFKELSLERIYAHVDSNNKNSIKVLENLGFIREGVLRRAALHRGNFVDRCVYSIIRSEAGDYLK